MHTDTVAMINAKISDVHARVRFMDRLGMKKAELLAAAAARGLDTTGTRSTLAHRLARTAGGF